MMLKYEPLARGKTAIMLDIFRYSKHQENWIPCIDEVHAETIRDRFRGLTWCDPRVHKETQIGQPHMLIIDEFSDNPIVTMLPNKNVSWWVILTKRD